MSIFYVGIDLGTSRTTITTSTGQRLTSITCVGYPKDVIAHKRLKKDYLLGEEALANRLSVNLVWPLADGVIREDVQSISATKLILQDILARALPEKNPSDQIYAAIGVPAQASINNKKAILSLSKGVVDKILIVSEPFAVAYSIDRFDECLIVDIGAGTTDLCRMHGAMPDASDQLTLTYAGNFLDQELTQGILHKFPSVQLTPQIIKRIKEKHGFVYDVSEPILVTLTEQGIPQTYEITDVLRAACLKLTDPISTAVQQLVGSFDPDFQEKLRKNVIVAGGGSRLKGIDRAIEKSLELYGGGSVTCVQDAEYCGSVGTLKMCLEMPDEYWEQLSAAP